MILDKRGAVLCFAAAVLVVVGGLALAVDRYPGGFDWAYEVISSLASPRRNPDGGRWLAGSLLVAVAFLWPVANHFRRAFGSPDDGPVVPVAILRGGLVGGALLGIEGIFHLELSRHVHKAHELLALLTFLGFYGGVLGLYLHRIRETMSFLLPAAAVVLPLLAVGITQLVLYFDQRDIGWVGPDWREMGVPLWLSFAFWQWLAVAGLGIGLGYLVATSPGLRHARADQTP